MSSLGAIFEEIPFADRLQRFLCACRDAVGASAALLVEFDSRAGQMHPWVRASTAMLPEGPLREEVFTDLLALGRGGAARAERSLLEALGLTGDGPLRCYSVEVIPRWYRGTDALLCVQDGAAVEAGTVDVLRAALSRDREARLSAVVRAAVEASLDSVEITDQSVRVIYVNAAFERFTGYSRDEVVGGTLTILRDPDAPKHDPAFFQFAEDEVRRVGQWSSYIGSRRRDGAPIQSEVGVSAFDASAHGVLGQIALRRDLTRRGAREAALAMAHMEFRNVLAALPQAVAVIRDELVYFGNPALFQLLGATAEAVIGAPVSRFLHPEERPRVHALLRDGAHSVRVLRAGGAVRLVDFAAAGTLSFEGVAARISLLDDVTERQLARVSAEHADRLAALGALAASVAHEINNPLTVLSSNLEALRAEDDAHAAALDDALAHARRIRSIIADLRAFSRDDIDEALDAASISRVVSAAMNLVANELRHLATVRVDVPADLHARAHDGPLVQVLVNLLLNASHAMRAAPRQRHEVAVSARQTGDLVQISVRDSGPGIDPTVRGRLFQPFVSTRVAQGGTGLGLWICRRIVDGFGGEIRLVDVEPHGTEAQVTLAAASRRDSTPSPPRAEAPWVGGHIAVIDDEPAIGRAVARLLREHTVTVLDQPRRALHDLLQMPEPDVVLCDLMMPDVTGAELFRAVLASRPSLARRFVFITGGVFDDDTTRFLAEHASRVLTKPFDLVQLQGVLAELRPEVVGATLRPG
jgi:PAS domain S-box-containing protein